MLTAELVQKQVAEWCRAEGIEALEAGFQSGTVVLSGRLPTLRHARLLEHELCEQREVSSVVTSAIEVEPRRQDAEVLEDARRILASCDSTSVRVDVFQGVVSLTGDEPDPTKLQLLEDLLSGVPGVVDIRSTVTVDPPDERRESQIASDGA